MHQKSSSTKVYERIKEMILHLDLKPGDRIPELKICEQIGSSRTPVREALRQLSSEGLVTLYPRRFAEVSTFDDEKIEQVGTVRLSQELLACRLAILNASDEDFLSLQQLVRQCEMGAECGNIYDRIVYDLQFHIHIAEIGKNKLLLQEMQKTCLLVHLIQISKYTTVADSLIQIRHHQEIIDALKSRDNARVSAIICHHLYDFFHISPEIIAMYTQN